MQSRGKGLLKLEEKSIFFHHYGCLGTNSKGKKIAKEVAEVNVYLYGIWRQASAEGLSTVEARPSHVGKR